MTEPHTTVEVAALPACDIHGGKGVTVTATHDGKTWMGPWAFMCDECMERFGVGLGLGRGQRLIQRTEAQ